MIYTGYFAKLKSYESLGLIPVAICGKKPSFYNGLHTNIFAPTWEMFSEWKCGHITDRRYLLRIKREVLDVIPEHDKIWFKEFFTRNDGKVILLCYEKTGDFCHRHLVADWIKSELGIDCQEL